MVEDDDDEVDWRDAQGREIEEGPIPGAKERLDAELGAENDQFT